MTDACDEMRSSGKNTPMRQKLVAVPRNSKPKTERRLRWQLGRLAVQVCRLCRA